MWFAYALAAFGGAFAYDQYDRAVKRRQGLDAARQAVLQMTARDLTQGRVYAVQVMVDPRAPSWGGPNAPRDLRSASALIRSAYAPLGWDLTSPPAISDPDAAAKFFAGDASLWIFTGRWTRPEPKQAAAPPWAAMTLAQELPTNPTRA